MRILVVEDEKNLNAMIVEALADEDYSVDGCYNGLEALEFTEAVEYDTIILDVMMPVMDGFEFLRIFREKGKQTPIIFLTSRDSIEDRVCGLEGGGDYYLIKPFSIKELIAVVHVMTRKLTGNSTNIYTVADLSVDVSSKTVRRGDKEIELTTKEYAMLEYMIRNKGLTLSREQIENNVWNFEYEGGTNVVNVYIGYLRKKIDADYDKKLIHTVWGFGWVLREDDSCRQN